MSDERDAQAEDLLRIFHEESAELLADLDAALLQLETAEDDRALLDEVFRLLHTLKGTCSMYGFAEAAGLAHEVETLFDRARSGRLEVTQQLIDLALSTGDSIGAIISGSEQDAVEARRTTQRLMDGMQGVLAGGPAAVPDRNDAAHSETYEIVVRPRGDVFGRGINLTALLRELAGLGDAEVRVDASKVPPLEQLDPEQCYLSFEVSLKTTAGLAALTDALMFLDDGEYAVQRVVDAGEPTVAATGETIAAAVQTGARGTAKTKGVRVAPERLDELVDLVGELVTTQTLLRDLAYESGDDRIVNVSEVLERLSHELRRSVLDMRMVPIGSTFGRFTRYVRDLARDLGKDVVLVTEGSSAELDRSVIERIEEPLLHIIRNCLDHGIETPVDRRLAGKPEQGTVTLSAFHAGGSVYIRVADDGRGMDVDAVRAKAVGLGQLSADQAVDGAALASILCAPGFSTATRVTSVSGRGVGLDVVKKAVEDLQGALEIQSRLGEGMSVTIRLPLTLAIIECLIAGVGEERYIVPLANVLEAVECDQQESWRDHGRDLLDVRGEVLPFVRLRDFFGVGGTPPPDEIAVVAEVEGERLGLVVDRVIDRTQVVSKSLGRALRRTEGVVGATMLGDGSVALIVDLGHIQRTVAETDAPNGNGRKAAAASRRARRDTDATGRKS